jgi:hypothetical protein
MAARRRKPPAVRPPSGVVRRQRWALAALLAAAAVLALAAGGWLGASRRAAPVPVERFSHIHGLEAPAWADGDLLVSTHTGVVRVTPEGAWFEVGDAKHDLMGFRAHPSEPGTLYGSGHPDLRSGLPNPLGFVRSPDGGLTWETLALAGEVDFHALTVQASNGEVLYGFNVVRSPGLYRSLDGGRTWEALPSDTLLRVGGAMSLEVDPRDAETVFAGTPGGLLRSADGGRDWEHLAFPDVAVTALRFAADEPRTLYAYGADPEVGLVVSRDAGASWERLGLVLGGGDAVGYIVPHAGDPQRLYVGTFGMDLMMSVDGGVTWELLAERGTVLSAER